MVWEMALVLLMLVFIVLVIILIPVVLELRKTLSKIAKLADNLNHDLPEILDNVRHISGNTTRATDKLNEVIVDVVDFEKKISKELKEPVFEAAASIAGLLKGIQTFVTYFVKSKKNS